MRKFREWIPGKRAGGIIADGADFHSIRWAAEKPQLLLCPERVISGVESPLFHFFSAVRTLHQKAHPFGKAKNALPLLQETKRLQTLCGTTLLAVPLRAAAPHCPPSRADAVTGITRPRLLTRRLSAGGSKVIFPLRPSPPYTVRRLSWLGPQGYSSLSTPYDSILALSYHVFSVCQIKFLKITPPADRPRGSGRHRNCGAAGRISMKKFAYRQLGGFFAEIAGVLPSK